MYIVSNIIVQLNWINEVAIYKWFNLAYDLINILLQFGQNTICVLETKQCHYTQKHITLSIKITDSQLYQYHWIINVLLVII